MGCICSKGTDHQDYVVENEKENEIKEVDIVVSVQMMAHLKMGDVKVVVDMNSEGSLHSKSSQKNSELSVNPVPAPLVEDNGKTRIIERPKPGHLRGSTMDYGRQQTMSRTLSIQGSDNGEQAAAGWPLWLTSVAREAIQGWTPRSADSYEKISKIGQGTYSSVYKARDLKTGKIVAMKKVRFVNMDPESVRFMAREICILRKLDHPNVMKLEAIVTSRISGSLYLVFEYMEHDLAGLLASPKVKFTESQIKCYLKQLFLGLEHCHCRGILHRDIKGSNLLVDNNGNLKIGDFGLAAAFEPEQTQPLTSRVVTLWYRPPELLLGATEYGVAIDLWSAGCIVAELFAGKPIMPGRTEVEQMHKIFKLCGSPSQEFWRKYVLPHATSFKSQNVYKRRVSDTFRDFPSSALALVEKLLSIDPDERGTTTSVLESEFFTSNPLPSDPSSLPKYPPSKEFDVKIQLEEARRQQAESGRGQSESISRNSKAVPQGQGQSNKCMSVKFNPQGEESGTSFPIEPSRVKLKNGYSHSNTVLHPNALGWSNKVNGEESAGQSVQVRPLSSSRNGGTALRRQGSQLHQSFLAGSSNYRSKHMSNNDSIGYVPKRNRIHCSGPLMPPGGNMEDLLNEHERQIQEAVRKARKRN